MAQYEGKIIQQIEKKKVHLWLLTQLGCFLLTFCLSHDVIPHSYSGYYNYMQDANYAT